MNINKLRILIILIILIVFAVSAFTRTYVGPVAEKKFDTEQVNNLGNIWLRVTNYGFFGSGGEGWPSLEYPGGSSIDYLFYRSFSKTNIGKIGIIHYYKSGSNYR